MGVKDYDLNPDNNTLINGINIAEGCPPSGINNAIRQLMADVRADSDAQNTKAETPASAEELGPVKVGDGLKMGEDGTLSLDLVDGVDSTSTTQAPTAAAVKKAYDKASELNWIGVPRYWRSTNLPPNHCWANGDFVSFADWPELKEVYDAGGFQGMLMAWDADRGTKAANLGQWRPDAAEPTGLYVPVLTGQFMRCWESGADVPAGGYNAPGLPNITGQLNTGFVSASPSGTDGALSIAQMSASSTYGNFGYHNVSLSLNASSSNPIYGASSTVMPSSINIPYIIYLGNPA